MTRVVDGRIATLEPFDPVGLFVDPGRNEAVGLARVEDDVEAVLLEIRMARVCRRAVLREAGRKRIRV